MSKASARINKALSIAAAHGSTDGAHHKDWVIDQMVRALVGKRYGLFVTKVRCGEDGPDTYEWSEGVAP